MKNNKIVALQMDNPAHINVTTDTTFALGVEAQKRGFRLFAYEPRQLSCERTLNGTSRIMARGQWVTFNENSDLFYTPEPETLLYLAEAAYVLMRQNPPFNMAYIAATHLLELLPPSTRVINNPSGVRNAPEKLLVTHFPHLIPPTLISWDRGLIKEFLAVHKAVILKPLFEFGGNGIFLLKEGDTNLTGLLEMYQRLYAEPPIFQKYLPEIREGDKRIILINGKPKGVFKRIPPSGHVRSNMRLGGQAVPCDYTTRDLEICHALEPILKQRGLYLTGIDVIGDYLTEINVTSPTGIPVIHRLYNKNLAQDFWNHLDEQIN
jgi:glutathione synthase